MAEAARLEPPPDAMTVAPSGKLGACLTGRVSPPIDFCPPEWRTMHCLRTPIPAWGPGYSTVKACFRCCLRAELAHAQLQDNYNFWSKKLTDQNYTNTARAQGLEDLDSVLLGHSSDLLLADLGGPYQQTTNRQLTRAPRLTAKFRGASIVAIHGNADTAVTGALPHALLHADDLRLRLPLVLTSQGDPPQPRNRAGVRRILDHPGLAALIVNTPSFSHPKVLPWPRGVGNTRHWDALFTGEPGAQANQTARDRPYLLHCSCMSTRRPGRLAKLEALRANGFNCVPNVKGCNGAGLQRRLLQSKFTMSPWGAGHNNHRDWEALMAGSIALIDHDELLAQSLFATLPVISVSNWSLVTPTFLEAAWTTMQRRAPSASILSSPYGGGRPARPCTRRAPLPPS